MADLSDNLNDPPSPLGSVLVTGGCGFLGTHIVSLLLERYPPPQTSVSVVDLRTSKTTHAGASYHTADITDAAAVRSVLEKTKPDVVIHTASPVFSSEGAKSARLAAQRLAWKVNVAGTRVLLEESRRVGVRAFVYTSSASVISDTRTDLVNADERWSLVRGKAQPEYYSDTKAEAEELVLASNSPDTTSPFLTTALRPSAMFGEHDVQMIQNMLHVLRTGRTKYQLGDNLNLFDFTYVGNVAHAHLLAASHLLHAAAQHQSTQTGSSSSSHHHHHNNNNNNGADAKPEPTTDQPPPRKTWEGARARTPAEKQHWDSSRVDGEAFLITNTTPIPFWDFTRAVWQAYHSHAHAASNHSPTTNTTSTLPPSPPPPPAAATEIIAIPRSLALLVSTLMEWTCRALGLGAPILTPSRVTLSCMTRYFRTRKAQDRLGYVPVWTLEEGIGRTVRWFWEKEVEEKSEVEVKEKERTEDEVASQ